VLLESHYNVSYREEIVLPASKVDTTHGFNLPSPNANGDRFRRQPDDNRYRTGAIRQRSPSAAAARSRRHFSLETWLALTPPQLVQAHLNPNQQVMNALRKTKALVAPD
jgi:hypothetical protein